jgi:hypothetical protein
MLDGQNIQYEVIDGGDPDQQNIRDGLMEKSGMGVVYPQVFTLRPETQELRFIGLYSDIMVRFLLKTLIDLIR